jgi:hypothetical protein
MCQESNGSNSEFYFLSFFLSFFRLFVYRRMELDGVASSFGDVVFFCDEV